MSSDKDLFAYREDLKQYLVECGLSGQEAFTISERVRKGKLNGKVFTHELIPQKVTDWFSGVEYLPSREREVIMNNKKRFDAIIKQNLIASSKSADYDESFGYEINDRIYDEYYKKEQFELFIQEMKANYPYHYKKYAGDEDAKENKGGVGGELEVKKGSHGLEPPKMASVASSSRFCYLALRDGTDALDPDRVITKNEIEFEKECKIFNSGNAPQLDAYIHGEDMNIYVEVKCHEIFDSHTPKFKNKYWKYFKDNKEVEVFKNVALDEDEHKEYFTIPLSEFGIEGNRKTTMFDIKQLVCHLLGIAKQNKEKNAKLVYLFFKPKSENVEDQKFIDEKFRKLVKEIDSIFTKGLIPDFCTAKKIRLEAIALDSSIMCRLENSNKLVLFGEGKGEV